MKAIKVLFLATLLTVSQGFANETASPQIGKASELFLQNSNITSLKFDQIKKDHPETESKELQPLVSNKDNVTQDCRFCHSGGWIATPLAQGMVYIDGFLCHVANYPYSTIITVFEGPDYGLQTTVDYNGYILAVNYDYFVEFTPTGVIFIHEYLDCSIMTGLDQVIHFG